MSREFMKQLDEQNIETVKSAVFSFEYAANVLLDRYRVEINDKSDQFVDELK
jgi:hypothetical protein